MRKGLGVISPCSFLQVAPNPRQTSGQIDMCAWAVAIISPPQKQLAIVFVADSSCLRLRVLFPWEGDVRQEWAANLSISCLALLYYGSPNELETQSNGDACGIGDRGA